MSDISNRDLEKRIVALEIRQAVIDTKMNIIGYIAGTTLASVVLVLITQLTGVRL